MVRHVNEAGTTCSVPSLAYASGYLTGASVEWWQSEGKGFPTRLARFDVFDYNSADVSRWGIP